MAKIALRAYNREIETLVERGQIEEAIAHSKYIMRFFPKHVETYRLLGKAYIESQRYSEAADILQRILSVLPDDFVSQIGMSIIREDEGNLDAAIFHMERAHEIQPSNVAVQDELRRLYGRRDGVEPPRLRLTRGALVRLYAKGDLHRQAIAEIRAALAEDPSRYDLEVILARMYFLLGQKVEATDIASRLVSRLPYCLEANRVLADVLPATSRSEDAKIYQQRVYALDPYLAYISPNAPIVNLVPDNAVTLDRLDWQPSIAGEAEPAWAQDVGITLGEEKEAEATSNWLTTPSESKPAVELESPVSPASLPASLKETPETPEPASSQIPDWMQASGWGEATGTTQEAAGAEAFEEEATPGELPDWLKEMAPQAEGTVPPLGEETKLDWLDEILPPVAASISEEPRTTGPDQVVPAETPSPESNLLKPESQAAAEIQAGAVEALPDWLTFTPSETEVSPESSPEIAPASEMISSQPADLQVTPEKASVEQAANEPGSEAVIFAQDETTITGMHIEGTPAEAALEPAATAEKETTASAESEQQSALAAAMEPPAAEVAHVLAAPAPDVESAVIQAPEETTYIPAAPAVGAEPSIPETAGPETTPISAVEMPIGEVAPELSAEPTPPVSEINQGVPAGLTPPAVEPELPVSQAIEEPSAEIPAAAAQGQPELNDLDAAMAWLESLAAKQGADLETLSTPLEQRTETPPEWVSREIEQAGTEEKPVETIPAPTGPADQVENPPAVAEGEATQAEAAGVNPEISEPLAEKTEGVSAEGLVSPQGNAPASSLVSRFAGLDSETTQSIPQDAFENNSLYPFKEFSTIKPVETTAETEITPPEDVKPVEDQYTRATKKTSPLGQLEQPKSQEEMDADANFAWLEALAAQQGADEGTLITPPEDRQGSAPAWILEQAAEPTELTDASDLLKGTMTLEEPAAQEKESVEPGSIPDWLNPAVSSLPSQAEETTEITPPTEPIEWIPEPAETQFTPDAPVSEQPLPAESQTSSKPDEPLPAWLQGFEQATSELQVAPEPPVVEQPFQAESQPVSSPEEPLPTWLQGFEQATPVPQEEVKPATVEDLPDWLKGFETPAEAPLSQASDESISVSSWLKEQDVPAMEHPEPAQPAIEDTQPVRLRPAQPVNEVQPASPAEVKAPETVKTEETLPEVHPISGDPVLSQAQSAMQDGNIDQALTLYNQLIERGQNLDDIVHDLRDSLYRYPVDIAIWQTLGDAYIRSNHIQEALDAYTKAEELLK
jgi:tetratricopeptide (TPR) repeat protein